MDRQLRCQEIYNPDRLEKSRKALLRILSTFLIANAGSKGLEKGVLDENFKVLKDSYQYQAALRCKADVLLTINIKDFRDADNSNIQILTQKIL